MKVKIGDLIYDAGNTPIMLMLTEADKSNIAKMTAGANLYCAYPEDLDWSVVKKFMGISTVTE